MRRLSQSRYTLLVWALAVLMVALAIVTWPTQAQDGHARYHEYYKTWMQPGTTISCCNARETVLGVEHGDCEPTRAEIRDGNWYAWERLTEKWLLIPDDRIIRERNPAGEEAHLCFNKYTGQILCFVPPDTGG